MNQLCEVKKAWNSYKEAKRLRSFHREGFFQTSKVSCRMHICVLIVLKFFGIHIFFLWMNQLCEAKKAGNSYKEAKRLRSFHREGFAETSKVSCRMHSICVLIKDCKRNSGREWDKEGAIDHFARAKEKLRKR